METHFTVLDIIIVVGMVLLVDYLRLIIKRQYNKQLMDYPKKNKDGSYTSYIVHPLTGRPTIHMTEKGDIV